MVTHASAEFRPQLIDALRLPVLFTDTDSHGERAMMQDQKRINHSKLFSLNPMGSDKQVESGRTGHANGNKISFSPAEQNSF